MPKIESSYVQIYRDLLRDPRVVSSPPSYRCVLYTLLESACFKQCQQDDHGLLIDLKPGQFMCSIRQLAELANVGRKDVENAIAKFIKIKILGQEVRHRKSIFTILWGIKFSDTGTISGTSLGQVWDIKEEALASSKEESKSSLKEIKEKNPPPPPQTPPKKKAGEEDVKKLKSLIADAKDKKFPFSDSGIIAAFKETSGYAVQRSLLTFLKRNPKLPELRVPDRWLRSESIKEFEALELLKDYE